MQQSEFKISISVESYDEKPAENFQNCYGAEKKRNEFTYFRIKTKRICMLHKRNETGLYVSETGFSSCALLTIE